MRSQFQALHITYDRCSILFDYIYKLYNSRSVVVVCESIDQHITLKMKKISLYQKFCLSLSKILKVECYTRSRRMNINTDVSSLMFRLILIDL
jgi:hypothetical protein